MSGEGAGSWPTAMADTWPTAIAGNWSAATAGSYGGILIFSALFNLQCTCRRKLPWKLACKCTEDSKVHRRLPNCTEDVFGDEGHPGIEGLSGTPGSVASPESSETYNVLSPASGTPAVASS